jgi:hypothetical protein
MKASLITIALVTFLIHSANSQTVSFEIDTLYGFWHDASLTTHQANVRNKLYAGDTVYYKCKLTFDFTKMNAEFSDNEGTQNFKIFELNRYDETNKTFNASFYDHIDDIKYNVILSEGTDKNDGIVIYLRHAEKYNGKDVTCGRFGTHIKLE